MKLYNRLIQLAFILFVTAAISQSADAQPSAAPTPALRPSPSTQEIVDTMVQRNLERAQALTAFQGTRVYRLEYRGFPGARTAVMTVDVDYRSPASKEFIVRSEEGSKLVIDRVFKRMLQSEKEALSADNQKRIALNDQNYRFALVGNESLPTGPAFVLTVEPLNDNKLLYRGRIWVDARDFAVVRIEATPAKNPSFWTRETKIEQIYTKVGDFWLPSSNRSTSTIRLGGHADFTIDYRDYRLTTAGSEFKSDSTVAERPPR